MAAIPLSEVTLGTNSVGGTGVFDELMSAFKAHLQVEFDAHRIKGTDYANVYLGGMQTCLQQAILFSLQKQDADNKADLTASQKLLIDQKIETEKAQTEDTITAGTVAGVVGKQKTLYQAQIDGFDKDAKQKILKIYADNYAIRRSTASNESNEDGFLSDDQATVIKQIVLDNAGITLPV